MQLIQAGSAIPTSFANSSPDIPTRSLDSRTGIGGGVCQYSADNTECDAAGRGKLVLQAVIVRRRKSMDIFMAHRTQRLGFSPRLGGKATAPPRVRCNDFLGDFIDSEMPSGMGLGRLRAEQKSAHT